MVSTARRSGGQTSRALRLALAVWVVVSMGGCAAGMPDTAPPADARPTPSATPSAEPAPEPLTVGQRPTTVTIPAIGLSEPLIDLGIQADGSMEVPTDFDDVGWFTGGGRPGGIGPTVIAGHVDSLSGPAIFFSLRDLVEGDIVQVTDAAGSVFDYEVYRVGDYAKAEFPTVEVFGATADDEVRLITCTGLFDSSIGHYTDNRVVFGKRV